MSVSPNTQAVLLLTSHFSSSGGDSARPLTPSEWGRFAVWLKDHALTPEALMTGRPRDILEEWSDRRITSDRLEALLDRGAALAIVLERWLRAGLWVMTRADRDYPIRLKRRLGADSPAVLHGCGNRSLLDRGGLAVVGSRNAVEGDLDYARRLGVVAASQGHSIVSGGARGVDEASMRSALENEGTAVGVLADSLLRASSGSKYRAYLRKKRLVLVSAVHPEAGFSAGNAMGRNRYIHCLGDAALVVHSGVKGGTWNGAVENLEKRWVPLWVKPTNDPSAGNDALVKRGAKWICEGVDRLHVRDLWCDREGLISKEADLPIPKRSSPETCPSPEEKSPEADRGEPNARLEAASEEPEASPSKPRFRASVPVESEAESTAVHSKAGCGREALASEKNDIPAAKRSRSEDSASPEEELSEGEMSEPNARLEAASEESEASPSKPRFRASVPVGSQAKSIAAHSGIVCKASSTDLLPSDENLTLYGLFLRMISRECAESAKSPDEIADLLDVNKAQVNAWLRRAQAEKRVRCLVNPVRYEWIDVRQASLFGN